jgi:hypothetical protein
LIGLTAKDEQVNISQKVRMIFEQFFISNPFGVVGAAIDGNVDCEDYISHFRLGLCSMVFEDKTNNFEARVDAT